MHTAVSRKVVGKSTRDNSQRYCWWFWVYCFSNKNNNGTKAHERMLASAKLKESNKGGFDTTVPGTLYWSYPILPFGIVACKLFRQPFSKQLYLHVFLLKSIFFFFFKFSPPPPPPLLPPWKKKVLLLQAIINVDVNLVLQNRVSWEGTFYRKQNLRLTCVTFLASSYIL